MGIGPIVFFVFGLLLSLSSLLLPLFLRLIMVSIFWGGIALVILVPDLEILDVASEVFSLLYFVLRTTSSLAAGFVLGFTLFTITSLISGSR
jgi:hypothetical protein